MPSIGGVLSTWGSSWVTSWRLPPVGVTARGMPPASVMTWCFEPGLRRSTGLGPVWAALERPSVRAQAWMSSSRGDFAAFRQVDEAPGDQGAGEVGGTDEEKRQGSSGGPVRGDGQDRADG